MSGSIETAIQDRDERIAELEKALRPFADMWDKGYEMMPDETQLENLRPTVGELWMAWVAIYSNGYCDLDDFGL